MERCARRIADAVVEGGRKLVVEKSTVPVAAAESVADILRANTRQGVTFQVSGRRAAPNQWGGGVNRSQPDGTLRLTSVNKFKL